MKHPQKIHSRPASFSLLAAMLFSATGCFFDTAASRLPASSMPAAAQVASADGAAYRAWLSEAHTRAAQQGENSPVYSTGF